MAKEKKLKRDSNNRKCRVAQNCNISDVTDSVEFANEPFDNTNKKKCARNRKNNDNC